MKVVYLTAGAGGMYCGSCMRDNTLVAALREQGRDVTLVPLFTPIRTDEPDVSEPSVFYGAINVYLQQRWPILGHFPRWVDRVLDSPALLRRVARWSGQTSSHEIGELTLSTMRGENGSQRKEFRRLIRHLESWRPDLVNLPNLMFVHLAGPIHKAIGIPVLCTLTGEDIFIDNLPDRYQRSVVDLLREQVKDADGFIATSEYYASSCRARFGIPHDRVHVVRPGVRIDRPDFVPCPLPPEEVFTVGYLARICADKGLHLLGDAVTQLHASGRRIRLLAAGYLSPSDRPYLDQVRKRLAEQASDGAFTYLGEVDRAGKSAMLQSLHVLSVPTTYREPKGLFVLEALAHGVPVVQPRHGAFPEWLELTGGGLLVDPNDPAALAAGIARMMDDPALRAELGGRGRAAVLESFTDHCMAERTWSVYGRYANLAAR